MMNPKTLEINLILPHYIQQIGEAQERMSCLPVDHPARAGEQFLISYLKINVMRLVWTLLLDWPFTAQVHPAITIVRNAELRPIDIQIADDLTPWLKQPAERLSVCESVS
ncbi:MAG: hypothetical protein AB9897_01180 [Anaerolineaceae bacterium]